MSWLVYADSYDNDADFSGATKSVRFNLTNNTVVKYIRTSVILYNDPGLTNITASIYYDKTDESKGDKIASSLTTHTKAEIITSLNGVVDLYFEFNEISLHNSGYYHFALHGVSSGFTDSSHLAWKTSYPDPVYDGGVSVVFSNLPKFPYTFVLIGDDF